MTPTGEGRWNIGGIRLVAELDPAKPAALAIETFNLETGPLLRGGIWRLGDDDHVVALVVHHIVSDGWSLDLLVS